MKASPWSCPSSCSATRLSKVLASFFQIVVLLFCFFHSCTHAGADTEFIHPNFSASFYSAVDSSGTFLTSPNGTFSVATRDPCGRGRSTSFYLCIIHTESNTIIWSGNRNSPVSSDWLVSLTSDGLSVSNANDTALAWSTPPLDSPVYAMQMQDTGNLVLLTMSGDTLWQSFDHPTDTIVSGQRLPAGAALQSGVSQCNLSVGDYRLSVTERDAVWLWKGQSYWSLSRDVNAIKNSNAKVSYMGISSSELSLLADDPKHEAVWLVVRALPGTLGVAALDPSGSFKMLSFFAGEWQQGYIGPSDPCLFPVPCGPLCLCNQSSIDGLCGACFPRNYSSSSCNAPLSYLNFGSPVWYRSMYDEPNLRGVGASACRDACSKDCSCSGFVHVNASDNCYLLSDPLGSIASIPKMTIQDTDPNSMGYLQIKLMASPSPANERRGSHFRNWVLILIGPILVVLVISVGFAWWRRSRVSLDTDQEAFSIPGLPVRFTYNELMAATVQFLSPENRPVRVAVKKINNAGIQGKKEFCMEVAVTGNARHANLVKLHGFCAEGHQRLLVYEFMIRGSLDGLLFGEGQLLEWEKREEIALGATRGLAYLHRGCTPWILHLDIKPENILLNEQYQAKISDFGLSKLVSTEQSRLFTIMRGTRGYLAPEWLKNDGISDKTDVYSYGLLLLEIVSGRRNSLVNEPVYFPALALNLHERRSYLELADPRMEGRVASEQVEKMVRVALCCLHHEPRLRPSMDVVVRMMSGEMASMEPQLRALRYLRFYNQLAVQHSGIDEGSSPETAEPAMPPLSYISAQELSGPR